MYDQGSSSIGGDCLKKELIYFIKSPQHVEKQLPRLQVFFQSLVISPSLGFENFRYLTQKPWPS